MACQTLKRTSLFLSVLLLSNAPDALGYNGEEEENQEKTLMPVSDSSKVAEILSQSVVTDPIFRYLLGERPTDKVDLSFINLSRVNKNLHQAANQFICSLEAFSSRFKIFFPSSSDDEKTRLNIFLKSCQDLIGIKIYSFLIKIPHPLSEEEKDAFNAFKALKPLGKDVESYKKFVAHCSHYRDYILENMGSEERRDLTKALKSSNSEMQEWLVENGSYFFPENL